jgi:hypothetical protein
MIKIEKIQNNTKYLVKLFDKHPRLLSEELSSKSIYATNPQFSSQCPLYTFVLYKKLPITALAFIQVWFDPLEGWISPFKMPFGGMICLPTCPAKALKLLLKSVALHVKNTNGKQITITSSPEFYNPKQNQKLSSVYLSQQYKRHKTYQNYHIPILDDPFQNRLSRTEKKRLQKCKNAKFTVEILTPFYTKKVYEFIHHCRMQKNHTMTLTYKALKRIWLAPTQHITVFGVFDRQRLIAVSMTARVNRSILYNYLPASLQEYNPYSPTVLLMEKIYEYCQKEKVKLLDLGISVDQFGTENPSLIRFKRNIGGIPSQKITYVKDLNV